MRFDECGADGLLRDSGLLRYAQEVAWVHSESAGFDRRWYRERGLTWLVRGAEMEVAAPIEHGESVEVSTEVIGWRRVWARRLSRCIGADGTRRAELRIDWVLLGPDGSPVRVPAEIADFFTSSDVGRFRPVRLGLGPTPADATEGDSRVRLSDLDPMAHVNNAAYLDYAVEQLGSAGAAAGLKEFPRAWALEFVRPAGPGEDLRGSAWREDGRWAYRLTDASGKELFGAALNSQS